MKSVISSKVERYAIQDIIRTNIHQDRFSSYKAGNYNVNMNMSLVEVSVRMYNLNSERYFHERKDGSSSEWTSES